MTCNVTELSQPVNVPVDDDLYRLVQDYEYGWVYQIDPGQEPDLDRALYPPAVKKARRMKKSSPGKSANSAEPRNQSPRRMICLYNKICVPSGFTYDGASVPRLAWSLTGIRPDGLLRAAAAVHDWIYRWQGALPEGSHQFCLDDFAWQSAIGEWKRKDCDRLFGRMMREAGVSPMKRKMAYLAVRLLGGLSW